ncbi:class I SAM-dependent methyltransferase [Scytonema millei]|uniref:Class I SAM-dependent methyltransferase n=1 Tax=Scytonema millei VB511283 TaxID=1245923 RepID=A0A9X5I3G8_9CYAN|nr:class I SAM-dependent methyltransferase [Scytonema millei]NHC33569.1 class I SAM-dependent methyltransferase [Scytonema millei VB511283]
MSETMNQKIQKDFDRIALLEQPMWNHNSHYHRFLLKQLTLHCDNILEIGCGTGKLSRLLAQRADRVTAIDLSPKMIEIAKQQSQDYANINFQVADILKWRFPVSQFDAIVSIATFHHLPLERLLPNLEIALKPGGKLIVLDLLENEGIQGIVNNAIAIPLNWLFQICRNRGFRPTRETVEAWREHLRTDKYLTQSQVQYIYKNLLTGANVKIHLFWRYSIVWKKL